MSEYVKRRQTWVSPIFWILAPANSGKSWFTRKYQAPSLKIADGDAVITRSLGWPEKSKWYAEPPAVVDSIHLVNWALLVGHGTETFDVMFFNGKLFPRVSQHVCVVGIDDDTFARNVVTRDPDSFGHSKEQFDRNLEHLIDMCHRLHSQGGAQFHGVFENFELALARMIEVRESYRAPSPLVPHVKDRRAT